VETNVFIDLSIIQHKRFDGSKLGPKLRILDVDYGFSIFRFRIQYQDEARCRTKIGTGFETLDDVVIDECIERIANSRVMESGTSV